MRPLREYDSCNSHSLLHTTHIGGKSGLVTDGGGDTTEKGGHLGTGLGESENVVNEEQHILSLLITEVLGDGKTGKSNSGSGTRGLVHLSEDYGSIQGCFLGHSRPLTKSDLGVTLKVDDTGLSHLVVQVVTLSSSLTDTGEDGVTTVSLGDVVDKLLDQDGFTDTGTTEKSNLSSTSVGGEEVDDLDTGLEDLGLGGLLDELRGVGVDGGVLDTLDRTTLVDGLTNDVHDSTERVSRERGTQKGAISPKSGGSDGDGDGSTSVDDLLASDETLGTVHGNGSDSVLTQVLGDLEDKSSSSSLSAELDLEGVQDRGEVVRVEVDIDDGTNDGLDGTGLNGSGGSVGSGRD